MTDFEIRRATIEAAQQAIEDSWNETIPVARTLERFVERLGDIARRMGGAETRATTAQENG
jgi:hypothetical protein